MRVMELGLRELGKALNQEFNDPNWDRILTQCENELKRRSNAKTPEWRTQEQFFYGAIAMLRSVKIAWRNPTMHVDRNYNQEQAEDIMNTVKGFMRQLATKLNENTK